MRRWSLFLYSTLSAYIKYYIQLPNVSVTKNINDWEKWCIQCIWLPWKQKINLVLRTTFNTTGSKCELLVIPTYHMNPQLNNSGNYSNKWQAADSNNLLTKPRTPINCPSMTFTGIIIKRSVPISKTSHCFSVTKTNRLNPLKKTLFFLSIIWNPLIHCGKITSFLLLQEVHTVNTMLNTGYIPTNSSVMSIPLNALEQGTQIIQHLVKACSYFLRNLFCKIHSNSSTICKLNRSCYTRPEFSFQQH